MAKTMVFIDSRVNDLDLLVSQFEAGTEYHILDASSDGVLQIEAALAGKSDYTSIQIISHGAAGTIAIGNTTLTSNNLSDYQSNLETIGHSLTDNGDMLLYGCSVGAGNRGHHFIDTLSHLTNADVAASYNLTGSAAMGGDWKLEVLTGPIESKIPFLYSTPQHYDHTFGNYANDYVLAKMSLVVYSDDPSSPIDNTTEKIQIAKNAWDELKADGWHILEKKSDGQYGIVDTPNHPTDAYISFAATVFEKDNKIVIAYRGTNDPVDWYTNFVSTLYNWDYQFTHAIDLAASIKKQYPDAQIEVTGHSLGGGLAQIVSQIFGFSGATFDALGTRNSVFCPDFVLEASQHSDVPWVDLKSKLTGIGVPDSFTNYTDLFSLVSGIIGFTNDHLGKEESLFSTTDQWILDAWSWNPFEESISVAVATSYLHYMGGIVELMRQKSNQVSVEIVGTSYSDILLGNSLDNIIHGYAGNDVISAGPGNDTIFVGLGYNKIHGGSGNDTAVFTHNFADYSISYDNTTSTFTVKDNVGFGAGTDIITNVENFQFADVTNTDTDLRSAFFSFANEGDYPSNWMEGNDTVQSTITYTLGENVKYLVLIGTEAINGTGNALDNTIQGNGGNNILSGLAGNDHLVGGLGNDTMTGGAGNDWIEGGLGNDSLDGGLGNDRLNGGLGNDTMIGGTGNDYYTVDSAGDVVTESAYEGYDIVESSVTYTLGANVEDLSLTGSSDINGTGNALDNNISGNGGDNILSGLAGND